MKPTKKQRISAKSNHIALQIDALTRSKSAVKVGGAVIESKGAEIKFQMLRLQALKWADAATNAQIKKRITQYESRLTPEQLTCKYGVVSGLSTEAAELISLVELLEIALGTHPGVK